MKPMYFNSIGSMSSHAENYPVDCFAIRSQPRQCRCGQIRISYEVMDKQDNEIIDILILCPLCAKRPTREIKVGGTVIERGGGLIAEIISLDTYKGVGVRVLNRGEAARDIPLYESRESFEGRLNEGYLRMIQ